MNASDDQWEPLGESPAIAVVAPKYQAVHQVTMYQARCTSCGTVEEDYGDFGALRDAGDAISHVVADGWFERTRNEAGQRADGTPCIVVHTVELLCPNCQKCEICDNAKAHPDEEGEHMVCQQHENHVFEEAS
ncbi:hypothetical protein B7435_30070 [Mycolicibacterium peregrinum]|uniref:Uncharacterized protein n=1 Tax=Mycolicibacterium alvei TaxID=67081 RepID=A0A6N4V3N3_9MYCO|nr:MULTISPECIES: hypothetical protein [Mycolicibacterium]MCV7003538.1 hypothetical protein [Mycolicibacterium alvei]OWL95535.1 hypothetical protein B7435_30070 [Mycolicibacterium peregrinum]BBX30504.1 hypothetical protein MALV_56290 [Mycolicibacterium alvei]